MIGIPPAPHRIVAVGGVFRFERSVCADNDVWVRVVACHATGLELCLDGLLRPLLDEWAVVQGRLFGDRLYLRRFALAETVGFHTREVSAGHEVVPDLLR